MASTHFQQFSQTFQLTKPAKNAIFYSLAIMLVSTFSSIVFFFFSQPQLPLFYSLALPSQQLVPNYLIFIIPFLSLICTGINFLLFVLLKKYDRLLTTLFSWSTITIQILFLFVLLRVIYVTI